MDKMDLYTNLSNQDDINNGYWTPIFEIINKIDISLTSLNMKQNTNLSITE